MAIRVSVSRSRAERTTFRNGHAFLGYYHKRPDVEYGFDGQKLVCWLRLRYYIETALVAIVLGPLFTIAVALGAISPERWFIWLIVVTANGLGWVMLLETARTRSRIEFDFAKEKMLIFVRPVGLSIYSLELHRVIQVIVNSFYRPRNPTKMYDRLSSADDCPLPVVYCHELALQLNDASTLTLLETTDESVIQEIKKILDEQVRSHAVQ